MYVTSRIKYIPRQTESIKNTETKRKTRTGQKLFIKLTPSYKLFRLTEGCRLFSKDTNLTCFFRLNDNNNRSHIDLLQKGLFHATLYLVISYHNYLSGY